MDSSRIQIRALQKNAGAALDLLADVALHPTFPAEEVERQRGQRLNRLVARRGDPSAVASTVMAAALYGSSHPYGFTELGTEAGVKGATRDDMTAFWKQNFVPGNAALVVAGAITRADLERLAEQSLGAWASATPPAASAGISNVPAPTRDRLVIVDIPGAPQTQMRVVRIGVPRKTPDYAALEVMDMILGGLFSSRINLNLREAHGYTYGAFAAFQYRKGAGPFFVGSGVRTNVTGPAVAETFKELARMQNEPVTGEELMLARESLIRSLPGSFETTLSTVFTFAGLYVYDLGLDYYAKFPQEIGAVTAAQVQDVAKRYLTAGSFTVVLVGDRARILPQLAALKLGPAELRDADGNVKTR
jgi:zinc protease